MVQLTIQDIEPHRVFKVGGEFPLPSFSYIRDNYTTVKDGLYFTYVHTSDGIRTYCDNSLPFEFKGDAYVVRTTLINPLKSRLAPE